MLCTVYALYILVCPSRWGITRYPNWLPFISGKMMIMFGTSNQLDTSSHHEIKKKMASQFVKTPIYNCWFWMVISPMGKCGFHNSSIFIICKNCVWCTPVTFQESHRHIFWTTSRWTHAFRWSTSKTEWDRLLACCLTWGCGTGGLHAS